MTLTQINHYQTKDNKELLTIAFQHINAYKRSRALADYNRKEGNRDKADIHELKRFRAIDGLELTMRAIQKGLREINEDTEDESE
jgi:hypothetical protein